MDAASLYRGLHNQQVTFTAGAPTLFVRLLKHVQEYGLALPHLQLVGVGGDSLPTNVLTGLQELGIECLQAWGEHACINWKGCMYTGCYIQGVNAFVQLLADCTASNACIRLHMSVIGTGRFRQIKCDSLTLEAYTIVQSLVVCQV